MSFFVGDHRPPLVFGIGPLFKWRGLSGFMREWKRSHRNPQVHGTFLKEVSYKEVLSPKNPQVRYRRVGHEEDEILDKVVFPFT